MKADVEFRPAAQLEGVRRRYLTRPEAALTAAVGLFVGVGLEGWWIAGTSTPTALDRMVDRHLLIRYDRFGTDLDSVLNHAATAMLVVATLIGLCLVFRRHVRDGCLVIASPLLAAGLVDLVKPVVGRHNGGSAQFAYPSGHEAVAVALAMSCGLVIRSARSAPPGRRLVMLGACVVLPVLLGVAVVGLRWHYPTDVLAGGAVGAGMTIVVAQALDAASQRITR